MAIIDLEDLTGNIELVAFPETYDNNSIHFEIDRILDVSAKIDRRNEQLQLICESVTDDLSALGVETLPTRTIHLDSGE